MSRFPFDKFDVKALWAKPHPFTRRGPAPEDTPEPQTIGDLLDWGRPKRGTYEWAVQEKARLCALTRAFIADQSISDDAIWDTIRELRQKHGADEIAPIHVARFLNSGSI